MLIDRYPAEDVFARVPELANQTDPVLVQLDRLLDDDRLVCAGARRSAATVSADRRPWTALHACRSHSAPAGRQASLCLELPGNRRARGR